MILQEVDAAGARRRGDPHEAEGGGGLVADMGGNHAADELGSSELALWHHTWKKRERRERELIVRLRIYSVTWVLVQ